jgi:hypothetical protein
LTQETEPLHDALVEVDQLWLAQAINVNHHIRSFRDSAVETASGCIATVGSRSP